MNPEQPLISIIITILNGEETISSCLESICRQTFIDYEVVIIDGGSTDRTLQKVEEVLLNKKVKVLAGCGIYQGLNAGILVSNGKWLYFMGADDKFHNDKVLETISSTINDEKLSNFKAIIGNVYCVAQNEILYPKTNSPFLMRYHVHHQGIFYERNLFSDLRYNEVRRIASDYELNLIIALKKIPLFKLEEIFCDFGGNGVSEKQLQLRNREIKEIHRSIYNNVIAEFVNLQFDIRSFIGSTLRKYNLTGIRQFLKKIFT